MCSNRALYLGRLLSQLNIRSVKQARQLSNGSYFHNPGSEPLEYGTLGNVLERTAHKCPGEVAIRSAYENVTITYEQLLTQVDSLGCFLRAQGFEKGDRLGIWSHNSASWIVTLLAAARVGVIPVAINPAYEKHELNYCINKAGLKGLFIGSELKSLKRNYYNQLDELIPELRDCKPGLLQSTVCPTLTSIITDGQEKLPGAYSYNTLVSDRQYASRVSQYDAEISPDDGCVIHFTSGTSGKPKAVLSSHLAVVNNSCTNGKRNFLHEEHHRVCVQVPIFHALGSIITVLASYRFGATTVVAAPSYSVDANLKALVNEKCSVITGTPTMFVDLVYMIKNKGVPAPKLRVAMTAGSPCSPHLISNIKECLRAGSVQSLYGLTESTGGMFQTTATDTEQQIAETVGYVSDYFEVKIVDENGKLVPFGTPGELMARSLNNMMYYWNDPEKTAETIDPDGWMKTGDKFVLSADGYGSIVGRLKDIVVRGGENIAPKEIEDLLDTHADIVESQVVGVSDERLGEEICAVVRLREGASVTMEDIKNHCSGRLAKFKTPRLLRVVEEFPKTASGKIQKYKLREMIDSGKL